MYTIKKKKKRQQASCVTMDRDKISTRRKSIAGTRRPSREGPRGNYGENNDGHVTGAPRARERRHENNDDQYNDDERTERERLLCRSFRRGEAKAPAKQFQSQTNRKKSISTACNRRGNNACTGIASELEGMGEGKEWGEGRASGGGALSGPRQLTNRVETSTGEAWRWRWAPSPPLSTRPIVARQ